MGTAPDEKGPANRPHRCLHLQGRGNRMPRFAQHWYCPLRSNGVSPQRMVGHCSPQCEHYLEDDETKERTIMAARKYIQWSGPARKYFPDAEESDKLWYWCKKLHDRGASWEAIGQQITEGGIARISVWKAVKNFEGRASGEGSAGEKEPLSPMRPGLASRQRTVPGGRGKIAPDKPEAVPAEEKHRAKRKQPRLAKQPKEDTAEPVGIIPGLLPEPQIVAQPARSAEEAVADLFVSGMDKVTIEVKTVRLTGTKRARKGGGNDE